MLRDRLPCRAQAMLHDQPRADLEERLTVAVGELIENCPPRRIGDGAENVSQARMIGKSRLACKPGLAYGSATGLSFRLGEIDVAAELAHVQLVVVAAGGQQLSMRAAFDNL